MKRLFVLLLAMITALCAVPYAAEAASPYQELVLESLYFMQNEQMVILDPSGMDNIIPYVVLSKKEETNKPWTGSVIVTTYEAGGTLHDVSTFELSTDSLVFGAVVYFLDRNTYKAPAIDFPAGGSAKAFYWNSTDYMEPYIAAINNLASPSGVQPTGVIPFPEVIGKDLTDHSITITKNAGVRQYSHNATPNSLFNWSTATEIFLDCTKDYNNATVKASLGTSSSSPITARNFAIQFKAGAYTKLDGQGGTVPQDSFVFTILNDFYSGDVNVHTIPLNNSSFATNCNLGEGKTINALIRSGSPSGYTWMGYLRRQTNASEITAKWTAVPGKANVYQTVKNGSDNVTTLFDFAAPDLYGASRPYVLVNSVDEVAAKPGSFYQDTLVKTNVYCNPYPGHQLDDITVALQTGYLSAVRHETASLGNNTLCFEDIGLLPYFSGHVNNQFGGSNYDGSVFGFFNCKFTGSQTNAVSFVGKYTIYFFDTIAAYGFRDGFNYHGPSVYDSVTDTYTSCRIFEVNCLSYAHGDFNRTYGCPAVTPGTTNNSNNASTMHDHETAIRVGCKYWNTQGPLSNGAGGHDIYIGCEAYNVETTPSDKAAFSNGSNSDKRKGYIVDCFATGTQLRSNILGADYTYVLDITGLTRFAKGGSYNKYDPLTITWDEIMSGTWKEN